MKGREKLKATYEQGKFTVHSIWERLGFTKHLGSTVATQRLIDKMPSITSSQRVLEIGCGMGYTACLLAKNYRVDVVALDASSKLLGAVKERAVEEDVDDRVSMVNGDAHELPFPSEAFDVVVAESVLILCDKAKVSSEVYRVLKPNGVFGNNEGTYLKPPPSNDRLIPLMLRSFGLNVQFLRENEWRAVYREAGFEDVSSTVYPINFREELNNLRIWGIRRYLSTLAQAVSDPTMRRTLFKKDTLRVTRQMYSYAGYGLYVSTKT